MPIAVGIDLGTTNSCVAVYRNGEVEIIPNDLKNLVTPSYVSYREDGRFVGDVAKNEAPFHIENTIFDVKRLIGRKFDDECVQNDMKKWPFRVINDNKRPKIQVEHNGRIKTYNPEEISSMVLGKMKEIAEAYLGETVTDCVITVPAYFNNSQREATIDAGRLAKLKVLRILNEPTAAAIGFNKENKSQKNRHVLVYDLGGGTFDVSIVKLKQGNEVKVLATGGNTHLGGVDFDNNIVDYVLSEVQRQSGEDMVLDKVVKRRLRAACEKAKRQLSEVTTTKIVLDGLDNMDHFDLELTRDKFNELNRELFEGTLKIVEECLKSSRLKKADINEIALVGGSTRIPKIRELVQEFFDGKELNKSINPDQAVANGASIFAYVLTEENKTAIKEVNLLDITPLSLGIKLVNDVMWTVVPKNTSIPSKQDTITIPEGMEDTSTTISVYEGERSVATKNNFLGNFTIKGFPPRSSFDTKVKTIFEIDHNGVLTVSSNVLNTEINYSITITYDKGRMSEGDIKRIQDEAEKFKDKDAIRVQAAKEKNNLFSYCDETIFKVNKKIRNIDPYIKEEILDLCKEALQWLEENPDLEASDYKAKYDEITSECEGLLD